jgi:deoxyadenosine/deoxycytidine kinase
LYTLPFRSPVPSGGIVIVGPCAAGKTTLAQALRARGYVARQIAQEHSYVPDMWLKLSRPETLIYLDASFERCTERKRLSWTEAEYAEQRHRLRHAREHCQIYINSDALTPEQVLAAAIEALRRS